MAEYICTYKNLAERAIKIEIAESKGLRMLHDNYDPDWQNGSEPHGTLIFTNEPEETPVYSEPRNLAAELDTLKAELKTKGVIT